MAGPLPRVNAGQVGEAAGGMSEKLGDGEQSLVVLWLEPHLPGQVVQVQSLAGS